MKFINGAKIYDSMKQTHEELNDYHNNLDEYPVHSHTGRLIKNQINITEKSFNEQMQEEYVMRSDFEQRQLELFEKINNLKSELKSRMTEEEYNEKFPPEPLW